MSLARVSISGVIVEGLVMYISGVRSDFFGVIEK